MEVLKETTSNSQNLKQFTKMEETSASSNNAKARARARVRVCITRKKTFKDKRAKLYIIRRCLYMLICWRERAD